jgi:osmotically-inducible protein OsmY
MGRYLHSAFTAPGFSAEQSRAGTAGDELIRLAVLNALHWDLAVPRNRVNVQVERGHVTLTGTVDRPYSKGCAERDARDTARVTGVTNAILVGGHEATAPSTRAS